MIAPATQVLGVTTKTIENLFIYEMIIIIVGLSELR